MSIVYVPRDPSKVARTDWSYADGGFDANVHGGQLLGALHVSAGLPIDPYTHRSNVRFFDGEGHERVPFEASARDTTAWAHVITQLLAFVDEDDEHVGYINAWRDFLATCGGYSVV